MNRCLTIDEAIRINQFSQWLHSMEEMTAWFSEYSLDEKRDVMYNLLNMMLQAHPRIEDIRFSAKAVLKERSTSAVMLLNEKQPFDKFGYKICALPEKDLTDGFLILLQTLSVADQRRRSENCQKGCNHWWHADLSDESVLDRIRKGV